MNDISIDINDIRQAYEGQVIELSRKVANLEAINAAYARHISDAATAQVAPTDTDPEEILTD